MRGNYTNRKEAARPLIEALEEERGRADLLVLGVPRGGVPVAFEVARALGAPLDLMLVRKLGFPWQPELAMGAVATGGVRVMNPAVEREAPPGAVEAITERELEELRRREHTLRGDRPPVEMRGRRVILVDDGVATGATMRAAVQAVRRQGAARVIVAMPVASQQACETLRREADQVICPWTPWDFFAIGQFYDDFAQVSDDEVREIMERAEGIPRGARAEEPPLDIPVEIEIDGISLDGDLSIPVGARGLVLFAHGSGSSRRSVRNRAVAEVFRRGTFATLLFDLLSADEKRVDNVTQELRFDIDLLGERLTEVVDWAAERREVRRLPIGLFGASTGAAAALRAAARRPDVVRAVVSRGGRPDLAARALPEVQAPTLFLVGGRDTAVLQLNRDAQARMQATTKLQVIPGATHLFEESGALEQVADYALRWFTRYLGER